ncbi:MAG: hypothetical protein LLF94_01170 [Chlamydiales bacterium]|nr:hypothetical protein [Chlamydiales bacterium]
MDTSYKSRVAALIQALLATHNMHEPSFQKLLSDTLTACFHLDSPLDDYAKAQIILHEIFGFDVTTSASNDNQAKQLVNTLLYGLHFKEIDLSQYNPTEYTFVVWQALAAFAPIDHILATCSDDTITHFISFLFRHQKEGTFYSLKYFPQKFQPLIAGLQKNYYDKSLLKNTSYPELLKTLQQKADLDTREFSENFAELVTTLYTCLMQLYDNSAQFSDDAEILHQKEVLKKQFKPYFAKPFTYQNYQTFVQIFGFYGYPPVFMDGFLETSSLVEKTKNLRNILAGFAGMSHSITAINHQDIQLILSFVLTIISHINAISNHPEFFKAGLHNFTCTLATSGKDLSTLTAIYSLVEGHKSLCQFLGISDASFSIVVFDQSDEALFAKNAAYISTFKSCKILHISSIQALTLAKKLSVENLIQTHTDGSFGFGGARNCQFLLAPLMAKASRLGLDCNSMQNDELRHLFSEDVLGGTKNNPFGNFIFIVDDDMYIPTANFFSAALFAYEAFGDIHGFVSYQYGRATKENLRYWDLSEFLNSCDTPLMVPFWLEYATGTAFSEAIIRPKICLNLPQGNEEGHYLSRARGHFFLQPSQHLSGTRLPSKEIPTRFFVGLDAYLDKTIPYIFGLQIIANFIDPTSTRSNTALPWNDPEMMGNLANLRQGFEYIVNTSQETQKRFWTKFLEFFCTKDTRYHTFRDSIIQLIDLDVDAVLKKYQGEHSCTEQEKESLKKIGNVYKKHQKDAKLFWELGCRLAKAKDPLAELNTIEFNIKKFPTTQGLSLVAHSLGNQEFCNIISRILQNYHKNVR